MGYIPKNISQKRGGGGRRRKCPFLIQTQAIGQNDKIDMAVAFVMLLRNCEETAVELPLPPKITIIICR